MGAKLRFFCEIGAICCVQNSCVVLNSVMDAGIVGLLYCLYGKKVVNLSQFSGVVCVKANRIYS